MMDFAALVQAARSCRRFQQSPRLGRTELHWLVACCRVVPSARNAQVLRFALASSPESCARIFPYTHWAGALKEWDGPAAHERPTAYMGLLLPEDSTTLVRYDAGIIAQTVQLAATSRGWGCCIHASFNRSKCSALFQVPEGMELALLLALGVAAEERRIAPMPEDGSCNYWRDAENVHYVPKRSLEELIAVEI